MGTNYYHHKAAPCPTCGHQDEPRHIGKSSGGWVFALHVYPEQGISDLPDWQREWATGTIKNEYGDTLTPQEMLSRITERSKEWLRRDRIDGRHCVGHGSGTWDLIVGEFS